MREKNNISNQVCNNGFSLDERNEKCIQNFCKETHSKAALWNSGNIKGNIEIMLGQQVEAV
jgi:hypothetical protein